MLLAPPSTQAGRARHSRSGVTNAQGTASPSQPDLRYFTTVTIDATRCHPELAMPLRGQQVSTDVKQRVRTILAAALAALAASGHCAAQDIPGYPASIFALDPREVAMLPNFCKYTQHFREKLSGGSNDVEIERWVSVLGPAFQHLHHYCYGLMKVNRAVLLAREARVRQSYLTDAVREFDYVIDRSPDDFALLPEILTKKGENLLRLKRAPLAILELERAADLRPDYWPPFALMSDYYKDLGDIGRAREFIQRGLKGSPMAPALSRRLQELPADAKPSAVPARKGK